MIEVHGNLWTYGSPDAVVITTNGSVNRDGRAVMGRGVAAQAKMNWPELPLRLGRLIERSGNVVHLIDEFELPLLGSFDLLTYPVKHRYYVKAVDELIISSAIQLKRLTDIRGYDRVHMPRPGCNNGGRTWEDVRTLIAPILDDDRFVVVNDGSWQ